VGQIYFISCFVCNSHYYFSCKFATEHHIMPSLRRHTTHSEELMVPETVVVRLDQMDTSEPDWMVDRIPILPQQCSDFGPEITRKIPSKATQSTRRASSADEGVILGSRIRLLSPGANTRKVLRRSLPPRAQSYSGPPTPGLSKRRSSLKRAASVGAPELLH